MHLSGFLKNRIPFVVCGFLFDLLNNGKTTLYKDFMEKGATVDILEKRPNLGPEIYADFVDGWIKHGATVVGGCCEVGPAHIEELARRLKSGSKAEPDD